MDPRFKSTLVGLSSSHEFIQMLSGPQSHNDLLPPIVLPRHGDRRAVFEAYLKNIFNEELAAKRARSQVLFLFFHLPY